jgi:tetratricopeptide (TPR) repeat protein
MCGAAPRKPASRLPWQVSEDEAMSDALEPSYDPLTLREVYPDPAAVRARITELRSEIRTAPDEIAELLVRGELVVVLRGLGELDDALAEAQRAADRAEVAGTPAQQHTARVRLAHVHQWRGEFAQSNLAFTELLNAAGQFGPVIEAYTHQHAGLNDFDQRHYADAREHFDRALRIRKEFELPDGEIALSQRALEAAARGAGEAT